MNIFPPAKQRPALLEFALAVRSRASALRRDECGDWRINGRHGHVYAVPEGFQIYFIGTARSWTYAKAALSLARLTQDRDEEGFIVLDRLPTAAGGSVIREKLSIPKKRQPGEEELARLRAVAPIVSPFSRRKSPSVTSP
jgi:hypothetical protein